MIEVPVVEPAGLNDEAASGSLRPFKAHLQGGRHRIPGQRLTQQGLQLRDVPLSGSQLFKPVAYNVGLSFSERLAERPASSNDGELPVKEQQGSGRRRNDSQGQAEGYVIGFVAAGDGVACWPNSLSPTCSC